MTDSACSLKVMTTTHRTETPGEGLTKRKGDLQAEKSSSTERHESRSILNGLDILDNNHVNLLMAAIMSLGATVMVKTYMG